VEQRRDIKTWKGGECKIKNQKKTTNAEKTAWLPKKSITPFSVS
jgi:hypothetical protein